MASSVESMVASKSGERASSLGREMAGLGGAAWGVGVVVEKAITKSPLPLLPVEPVRARPRTARAARRRSWRESRGASVAITIMQEPSAGLLEAEAEGAAFKLRLCCSDG